MQQEQQLRPRTKTPKNPLTILNAEKWCQKYGEGESKSLKGEAAYNAYMLHYPEQWCKKHLERNLTGRAARRASVSARRERWCKKHLQKNLTGIAARRAYEHYRAKIWCKKHLQKNLTGTASCVEMLKNKKMYNKIYRDIEHQKIGRTRIVDKNEKEQYLNIRKKYYDMWQALKANGMENSTISQRLNFLQQQVSLSNDFGYNKMAQKVQAQMDKKEKKQIRQEIETQFKTSFINEYNKLIETWENQIAGFKTNPITEEDAQNHDFKFFKDRLVKNINNNSRRIEYFIQKEYIKLLDVKQEDIKQEEGTEQKRTKTAKQQQKQRNVVTQQLSDVKLPIIKLLDVKEEDIKQEEGTEQKRTKTAKQQQKRRNVVTQQLSDVKLPIIKLLDVKEEDIKQEQEALNLPDFQSKEFQDRHFGRQ